MIEKKMPDSWLCARCSTLGKTCCQATDIYVTPDDIRRIAAWVGVKDFFEYRDPTDSSYVDQSDDPVWRDLVFRKDGTRRVLCRDSALNCRFLGVRGCVLPMEVRPLICRLHPYQYTAQGLSDELSSGCPAGLLPADQPLEQALNMSRTTAGEWHRLLYAEIIKENDNDDRTDL